MRLSYLPRIAMLNPALTTQRRPSEFAAWNQPDALEIQVGLGAEKVEVTVVMQDPEAVSIRDRGKEEVDRRQSVVPNVGELALRINRATFDPIVYRDKRKSKQLLDQLVVVVGVPC